MSSPRLACLFAAVSFCVLSGQARADVTPAQAAELAEQLRAWMAGLVSPAVDVGATPVAVTAEGDHFTLTVAAPALLEANGILRPGVVASLKARLLDGGRWALDDLALPSPLTFTLPANAKAAGGAVSLSAAAQDFHGVLDPSFATPSTFDSSMTDFRIDQPSSSSQSGRSTSHITLQPAGDGRIDIATQGAAEQVRSHFKSAGGPSVDYTIARSSSAATLKAVSPAGLASLIRGFSALAPTLVATHGSLSPEQRTQARAIVFALRDLFAGGAGDAALEGIAFSTNGHVGTLEKASFGATMGSADGKLQVGLALGLEGFASPEVPSGVFQDYLPRRISLKPRISGIPGEDLIKLVLRAIDSDAADLPDLQDDAMALLGAGPLEVGVDALVLDLGRASLTAKGSLDYAGPADITGEAQISMLGLDALIRRANTTPEIRQIAPVLVFLKGIGRQEGEQTVWNVAYEDNKVTVNDTDLSALMPGR